MTSDVIKTTFTTGDVVIVEGPVITISTTRLERSESGLLSPNDVKPHRDIDCNESTLAFRLVGGRGPWEGRVEVFHDGQYGTVCDDGFGPEEAKVFCTMIGYNSSYYTLSRAENAAKFGPGSGPIWLDSVNCSGSESDISECQSDGWGVTDCDHGEDVGVVCPGSEVKLVGGSSDSIGQVNIGVGQHYPVCSDGWGQKEATFVCRMLGKEPQNGMARAIAVPSGYFGSFYQHRKMFTGFSCNGNESDIMFCNHTETSTDCPSKKYAGVSCNPLGSPRTHISLQHGYVKIRVNYYVNTWTDSSNVYNDNLAALVCNTLGYTVR
ncbi:scavenger receptor cysteine-rich domain superfamily protein-like [Gigantopelta aegis]|uniref:scavenger receptor cysteine-rich domain superfamily protein-like n=1 Tax=Gigantopelta aegis TaxID=1735272 RepID=UPI001B88CDCD|nr:scavenger receptor cysteine-rich domain superfamily protein-like [Gigantopelta aegis]